MRIFKENEVESQIFYQVPKSLFNNDIYKKMSLEAKMIYAILRDRMHLSRKNKWIMENGDIFLLYSRENLSKLVGCSEQTIRKAMKQLIDHKLIYEKRQGQGKANIIFVCHVEQTLINTKTDILYSSKYIINGTLNQPNISPSNTNFNNTENINTETKGIKSKIVIRMCYFINNYDLTDIEHLDNKLEAVKYYINQFEKLKKQKHIEYDANDWNYIIDNIFSNDTNNDFEDEVEIFKEVIDKHFDTDYKFFQMYYLHNFKSDTKDNRIKELIY